MASFFSIYVALFAALVFTFLVPGLAAYRFFKLKTHEIWAFVPLFSVLVSVQLIYYMSLAAGYSRTTIIAGFLVLTAAYAAVVYKKGELHQPPKFLKIGKIKRATILVFTMIFIIALAVLVISVWRPNQYGIVLTGSNWQDTPFHYDIIESINQGNFPPQTPNYSGTTLGYYYFVDFHTAIVEKVFGYLPSVMPLLNAIFILIFGLAVYALARPFGRQAAIIATIIAVFGWGLSYFTLFSALSNGTFNPGNNYAYQFGKLFGLPPVFDNLLQQRPMLVGLPVFALVLALIRDLDDSKRLLLAGILTGLVYEFHSVAFFCCYVAFVACLLINIKKLKFSYLYFVVPTIFALPFIFTGGQSFSLSLSIAFISEFAQNPLIYYFVNLGIPFVLAIISFAKVGNEYLKITFLFLFLIPNILLLTPWVWDMYKFFIFAWVPIAVLTGIMLAKTKKILVFGLVLLCVITSASVIIYNVGTNYTGLSWAEYNAGLWIRNNTPEKSVFLTYQSIQCPVTMVAGRLRVDSYVYWPYGHGIPLDQVQQRDSDVKTAYTGTTTQLEVVIEKYGISYIYVGNDEHYNFPNCNVLFNSVSWLHEVYNTDNLQVYQVKLNQTG